MVPAMMGDSFIRFSITVFQAHLKFATISAHGQAASDTIAGTKKEPF